MTSMPSSNKHTPQVFTSISRVNSPLESSFTVTNAPRYLQISTSSIFHLQDHPGIHTSNDWTRVPNLLSTIVIIYIY
jgi:hypothetical protein